ncbi:MAG: hypothetical protein MI861_00850, partial [Pirellulales bacterium]|nr:hypothetical protein [Pirellulales bacterium]
MLAFLSNSIPAKTKLAGRRKRPALTGRPKLHRRSRAERLEPRQLLAAVIWDGGGDGTSWSDAGNWDVDGLDQLPSAGDDVRIDLAPGTPFTVNLDLEIDAADALGSLTLNSSDAKLAVINRTLSVTGSAGVEAGTVTLTNATWDVGGTLTNQSQLEIRGNTLVNATLVQQGVLDLIGIGFGSRLTVDGSLSNLGILNVDNRGANNGADLAITAGDLSNGPTGVINFASNPGRTDSILGEVNNQGTIHINNDVRFENVGALLANQGNLTVAAGASLSFVGNPGAGQISATVNQLGGTLVINGSLELRGGEFNFDGGVLEGSATLVRSALKIGPNANGAADFSLRDASTIQGTIAADQVIRVESTGLANAAVTAAADLTNDGTIILERVAGNRSVSLVVDGSLNNTATGTILAAPGNGGAVVLDAALVNEGTLDLQTDGRLDGPSTLNRGTLRVGRDTTLSIGSAGADPHLFEQAAGLLDLTGQLSLDQDTLVFGGGAIEGVPNVSRSVLVLESLNPADFLMLGNNTVVGSIASSQTLRVQGNLDGGTELNNFGTIILDGNDSPNGSNLNVDGVLANVGQLIVTPTAGGNATLAATLNNFGDITLGDDLEIVAAGTAHTNGGNIALENATLRFEGAGSTFTNQPDPLGQITGSGTIDVAGIQFINEGVLSAGFSPGSLNITGDVTLGSNSQIVVEVGGRDAGTQFDQLRVSGSISLDGSLLVNVIDGFSPSLGDRFEILTFGDARGAFASVEGLAIAGSNVFVLDTTSAAEHALEVAVAVSDLDVQTVDVPAALIAGQEATIRYTVTNLGDATTSGRWRDAIYLSADDRFDPEEDLLIGRVEHVGDVLAGQSYTESLTAPLPGVLPGDYHIIVVANSSREVPDVNYANNIGISDQRTGVEVEELVFGSVVERPHKAGVQQFFRLNVPFGKDVRLRLAALPGAIVGGVGIGAIANPAGLPFLNFDPLQGDQQIVLEAPPPGDYFITLSGLSDGTFQLVAEQIDLEVRDVFPTSVGSIGEKTLTITGSSFDTETVVALVNLATQQEFAPQTNSVRNSRTISATFADLPAGSYRVRMDQQSQSVEADDIILVEDNRGETEVSGLSFELLAQENVRPGRDFPVTVKFTNRGSTDLPAAILSFNVTNGTARFPEENASQAATQVLLFAASERGDRKIIAPGESGTIQLIARPNLNGNPIEMELREIDPASPLINPGLPLPAPASVLAAAAPENLARAEGETTGETNSTPMTVGQFQSRFIAASDIAGGLRNVLNELAENPVRPPASSDDVVRDVTLPGGQVIELVPAVPGSTTRLVDRRGRGIQAEVDLAEGVMLLEIGGDCFFTLRINLQDSSIDQFLFFDRRKVNDIEFQVLNQDGKLQGLLDTEQGDLGAILRTKGVIVPGRPAAEQIGANLDFLIGGATFADFTNAALDQFASVNTNTGTNQSAQTIRLAPQGALNRLTGQADPNGQISRAIEEVGSILGVGLINLNTSADFFFIENRPSLQDEDTVEEGFATVKVGGEEFILSDFDIAEANQTGEFSVEFRDLEVGSEVSSAFFTFKFDQQSRKFRLTSITSASGRKFDVKVDSDGNIIELRDADTGKLEFQLIQNEDNTSDVASDEGDQRQSDRIQRNPANNTVTSIASEGRFTEFSYQVQNGIFAVNSIDDGDRKQTFSYSPQGLLDNVQDDQGNTTRFSYAGFGEVFVEFGDVVANTPDGKTTIFELDDNGSIVKATITDAAGNTTVTRDVLEIFKLLETIDGAGEVFRNDPLLNSIEKTFSDEIRAILDELIKSTSAQAQSTKPKASLIEPTDLRVLNAAGFVDRVVAAIVRDVISSFDPNDIVGPPGFGEANFITKEAPLPFTIRFENQADADAPAQEVFITQQLDSDLDLATFELGDVGFGDFFFDVPDGRSFFQDTFDLTDSLGVLVELTAGLDVNTGLASWTFRSLDPITGDLPFDALAGFLPPNVTGPEGEGFVSYTVQTKQSLVTADVIDSEATIVFDLNEPIDTPAIFHTIDDGVPDSSVETLPAQVASSSFEVRWSGQDDPGGSGIASFDVFISENDGPFTLLLDDTTETSTTFIGEDGKTYRFFSVATDNVGFRQADPAQAQATTTVNLPAEPQDVTAQLDVHFFGQQFNRRTHTFAFFAAINNPSDLELAFPLRLLVTNLNPAGAVVTNADGTLEDGTPYFDFAGEGSLAPGEATERRVIAIQTPPGSLFEFDPLVLAV